MGYTRRRRAQNGRPSNITTLLRRARLRLGLRRTDQRHLKELQTELEARGLRTADEVQQLFVVWDAWHKPRRAD
jgi:hypothetical protein